MRAAAAPARNALVKQRLLLGFLREEFLIFLPDPVAREAPCMGNSRCDDDSTTESAPGGSDLTGLGFGCAALVTRVMMKRRWPDAGLPIPPV